jgi:hypothetical protein
MNIGWWGPFAALVIVLLGLLYLLLYLDLL